MQMLTHHCSPYILASTKKPSGANWSNGPPPAFNRKAAALAPNQPQPQPQPPAAAGTRGGGRNPPGVLPGMGAALTHRRVRGGNGKTGEDVSAEFDFGQSNSGFNKEADKEKLLGNQAVTCLFSSSPFRVLLSSARPSLSHP